MQEMDSRLVIISGKAGYGKTELARQYSQELSVDSAWYTLDETDEDGAQLAEHLGNLLDKKSKEAFLLILDNFEAITSEEMLAQVKSLIRDLPDDFRLCIITKGPVPDFAPRLVMEGSCLLLDERELAFTEEEERQLAVQMGLEADAGAQKDFGAIRRQLHGMLGGWPAGVMLAYLDLKRRGLPEGSIDCRALYHTSMIGGFLNVELFGDLPQREQEFLTRTADLVELDPEACDQALGEDGAGACIDRLLERDLLVWTQEKGICRHPLVDLYLKYGRDRGSSLEAAHRAAKHYLESRNFYKAARQAAAVQYTPLVLALMEQQTEALLKETPPRTMRLCVEYLEKAGLLVPGRVPTRQMAGQTEALGAAAQYYYLTGQPGRMEDCLNQADSVFGRENKFAMYRALYRGLIRYEEDEEKNRGLIHNTLFLLEENNYPLPYLSGQDRARLERIREMEGREEPGRLRVTFFGDFRAEPETDGKPLAWRTRKGGELFAYLVKLGGKSVGRRQLLETLWNDELPDNAVTMLHNMLYNLRRELAVYQLEDLIEYKDKAYRIHMERVDTDASEIGRLCRLADKGDREELEKNKNRFASYWGRYLENVDSPWAMEDREYYDTRFLKGCVLLAESAVRAGQFGDGILFYKNAMLINSYSEDLEAELLKCYAAMGNLRQAKTEFERFCGLLKKELETEPGPKLKQVYREILHAQPPA